ncbi:hypothetical protein AXX17_AT1G51430 [Arabidopsis thaliana]|uniref:Uncharacterized protein n=2 Tax=Arabidopsis thaliana TaxID=3702 RepID=A0A178WC76_ARATH|nr:hypothetical protein AXX17_AT1G51430 [Arabidopsis thaliana]
MKQEKVAPPPVLAASKCRRLSIPDQIYKGIRGSSFNSPGSAAPLVISPRLARLLQ